VSKLFTSESVTEGHPDKVADAISDAVLDAMLEQDPTSRVAVETLVANGVVIVTGEATTEAYVEVAALARETLVRIGYDSPAKGLDGRSCGVLVAINSQSPDISVGVSDSWESRTGQASDAFDRQGAGDQGLMFGYAAAETPTLMPVPIYLAHQLSSRLAEVRKTGTLGYLRPDGKTQVSVRYDDAGDPVAIDTVVVSAQHDEDVTTEELRAEIETVVIRPVVSASGLDTTDMKLFINPTGRFVIGGPTGDSGVTGRKIIVDTYGGMARHGGGAFSGKDPSKVDRSASYALRWLAKTVVAAGLAKRCEVQVAYAIGKARPVGLYVDTFGTGTVPDEALELAVAQVFDLRPAAIIAELDLLRPIYSLATCYGHFGRELPEFGWESYAKVDELRAALA
jgi:S-adenosylmethionine synthetase